MIFTSDTHFGHFNVIEYSGRPFKSTEEMRDILVYNWNQLVGEKDIVYHLGDFTLSTDLNYIDGILSQLKGKIRLIRGNHDKWANRLGSLRNHSKIEWVKDYYETSYHIDGDSIKVVMSHYPMRAWNKSHYGSYSLHGHCHGSLDRENASLKLRRLDVGVDSNNYSPLTFEEIHRELRNRVVTPHHGD
jgi:calcineurin-like phosphoesterase family protein